MSKPRLNEETKGKVLLEYAKGTPIKIISERFGVHLSYPGLLARRRGLNLRRSDSDRRAMALVAVEREARP